MAAEERHGMPVPKQMTATRLPAGADELVVFSFPLSSPAVVRGLTPAQRDVLIRLLEGASNEEIAEARGTSSRTVANQVGRLLRHFGVRSRIQLVASLLEGDRARPAR